jgi:hypothetical protein
VEVIVAVGCGIKVVVVVIVVGIVEGELVVVMAVLFKHVKYKGQKRFR